MLPGRSELSAVRQSSLLNCAQCPQPSCHSNTEFLKLGHSSWHDFPGTSCDWHPLTPFQPTQSDRAHMRSRPSWTSGRLPRLIRPHSADSSSHLLEHLNLLLAAERHWVALSDELPAHSLDVSFTLFACSWHCSHLSRVPGSRSLAVLLSSRPFWHVFHQTVANFSFRTTVADPWMDPAQF